MRINWRGYWTLVPSPLRGTKRFGLKSHIQLSGALVKSL